MGADQRSVIAPARIRVLLLPAGKIRRRRFDSFVERLRRSNSVRLADVAVDSRPDRHTFSPNEFPDGVVFYDFVTAVPAQSQLELSPLELFRQPIVVLGLADGAEYVDSTPTEEPDSIQDKTRYDSLLAAESDIRTVHDTAILHKIILFDSPQEVPADINPILIPTRSEDDDTTAIQRLTSAVLGNMTDLMRRFQSKATVGQLSPSYFANTPDRPGTASSSSSRYRLSMPVIVNPAAERDSARPRASDRAISIAGFSTGLFKSRTSSPSASSLSPTSISAGAESNRIDMLVAMLFLQSGLWNHALLKLADATTRAGQLSDGVWYCKGVENTIVCAVLLAWANVDFELPQVILDLGRVSASTASPSPTISPLSTLSDNTPGAIAFVINSYATALGRGNITPLAVADASIRLSGLAAVRYLCGGTLDRAGLDHIVTGSEMALSSPPLFLSVRPSRADICHTLMNSISAQLGPVDYMSVLAGIASVLALLQMHRKRRLVLHELVASLVPYLLQARKVGAAELGLHPAVGPTAVGPAAIGPVGPFLSSVAAAFGVPTSAILSHIPSDFEPDSHPLEFPDADAAAAGAFSIKRDILRACIGVAEALPDFQATADFAALMLRTMNPRFACSVDPSLVALRASWEEQSRMWATIIRAADSARRNGLPPVETDYWDLFLVRNVRLRPAPDHLTVAEANCIHSDASSPAALLHNPWKNPASLSSPDVADRVLVQDDEREFVVTLQNPLDTDIEIDSVSLVTDGNRFRSASTSGTLSRRQTEDWIVTGTALESGPIRLVGCRVRVRGCRERVFPIFPTAWHPYPPSQIKQSADLLSRPESNRLPQHVTLSLDAVAPLPVLAVTRMSCPQSALMLLDGQRSTFTITLGNMSPNIQADWIEFEATDSVQQVISHHLSLPHLPIADAFELEHSVAVKPAVSAISPSPAIRTVIPPGGEHTFRFEVFAKPGLTDISVKFLYACVGDDGADDKPDTKTKLKPKLVRHVTVPLAVTVNSSVHISRADIVPLPTGSPWVRPTSTSPSASVCPFYIPGLPEFRPGPVFEDWLSRMTTSETEFCLLVLDVRNSWPAPVAVTIKLVDWEPAKAGRTYPVDLANYLAGPADTVFALVKTVQPGHSVRIPVPVPRFFLPHRYDPVRHLVVANEKQFTVSRLSMPAETERTGRELFWYREELLHMATADWAEVGPGGGGIESADVTVGSSHDGDGGEDPEKKSKDDKTGTATPDLRTGELDLRAVQMTRRMVDVLSLSPVGLTIDLDGSVRPDSIPLDELLVLRASVTNRSGRPVNGILRLQPRLRIRANPSAGSAGTGPTGPLDLTGRLTYSGVLEHELGPIPAGGTCSVVLGVCALAFGDYEVGASFDNVVLARVGAAAADGPDDGVTDAVEAARRRSTAHLLAVGPDRQRTYTMDRPLRLVAVPS